MIPQGGETGVQPANGYRSISGPQILNPGVVDTREFDTSKLKRILQSLETGLFFCQIFVFII